MHSKEAIEALVSEVKALTKRFDTVLTEMGTTEFVAWERAMHRARYELSCLSAALENDLKERDAQRKVHKKPKAKDGVKTSGEDFRNG